MKIPGVPPLFQRGGEAGFSCNRCETRGRGIFGESRELLPLLGEDCQFIFRLLGNLVFVQTLEILSDEGNPGANS